MKILYSALKKKNAFVKAGLALSALLLCLSCLLPAQVLAAEDTYTVTYMVDGETLQTQQVAHGGDAVPPQIPDKTGYDQIPPTWDHNGKNITAPTTINAVYAINEYTITYIYLDGQTRVLSYLHGEPVVMLPPPQKEGYHLKWDKTVETLTQNVTIRAVYTEPEQEDIPEDISWDNGENEFWRPIILTATALMIVGMALLWRQKKRLDAAEQARLALAEKLKQEGNEAVEADAEPVLPEKPLQEQDSASTTEE